MKKIALSLLLTLSFIFGYTASKRHLDSRMKTFREESDIRYIPTPKVANYLSLGFEEALGDIFWIEAINYYGLQLTLKKKATYKFLKTYSDVIMSLDPLFTYFYEWAGTVFVYNTLKFSEERLAISTDFVNRGIRALNEVYRYDPQTILKGAFNYSLELHDFASSLPYFAMVGRGFSSQRDMLIVASTYANQAGKVDFSEELKKEYFGYRAFEAKSRQELFYSLNLLSNPSSSKLAADFIRSLRIEMETDEQIRKMVESKISTNPMIERAVNSSLDIHSDPRLKNVLKVDVSRNWLPPELHVLISL